MGDKRSAVAVWVVGSLAALTFVVGVSAAVASPGGNQAHHALVATATEPTTVITEQTTTSTLSAPPPTPAPTTTTVMARTLPPATTIAAGAVSGRVIYHDGQPVLGARVTLEGSRGGEAVTDSAGRYRFDALARGDYRLDLVAESPPAPCHPPDPCIGSAIAMDTRPVAVGAGETQVADWVYPYDSPPTYSDGATFTSPPATVRG